MAKPKVSWIKSEQIYVKECYRSICRVIQMMPVYQTRVSLNPWKKSSSLAFFKEYSSTQSKIVGQLSKQMPSTVQRNPSKFRMFFFSMGMAQIIKGRTAKKCWEMAWLINFIFQASPIIRYKRPWKALPFPDPRLNLLFFLFLWTPYFMGNCI